MIFKSFLNKVARVLQLPNALIVQVPRGTKYCECFITWSAFWVTIFYIFLVRINSVTQVVSEWWSWFNLFIFSDVKSIFLGVHKFSRVLKSFKLAIIWFCKPRQSLNFVCIKFCGSEIKTQISQRTVPTDETLRK